MNLTLKIENSANESIRVNMTGYYAHEQALRDLFVIPFSYPAYNFDSTIKAKLSVSLLDERYRKYYHADILAVDYYGMNMYRVDTDTDKAAFPFQSQAQSKVIQDILATWAAYHNEQEETSDDFTIL